VNVRVEHVAMMLRVAAIADRVRLAVPRFDDGKWSKIESLAKILYEFGLKVFDDPPGERPFTSEDKYKYRMGLLQENRGLLGGVSVDVNQMIEDLNWIVEYETAYDEIMDNVRELRAVAEDIQTTYHEIVDGENSRKRRPSDKIMRKVVQRVATLAGSCGEFSPIVAELKNNVKWTYYQTGPSEFSYEGFKVVNRYGATSEELKPLRKAISEAARLLKSAGFGELIYGVYEVRTNREGRPDATGTSSAGGYYQPNGDYFVAYVPSNQNRADLVVHELGHRYWFRFMDASQRQYWTGKFQERGGALDDEVVRRATMFTPGERREMWKVIQPLLAQNKCALIDSKIEKKFGAVGNLKLHDYLKFRFLPRGGKFPLTGVMLREAFAEVTVGGSLRQVKSGLKELGIEPPEHLDDERLFGPKWGDYFRYVVRMPKGTQYRGVSEDFAGFLFSIRPRTQDRKRFIGEVDHVVKGYKVDDMVRLYLEHTGEKPSSVSEYGQSNEMEDWAETFERIVMKQRVDEETEARFWRTIKK